MSDSSVIIQTTIINVSINIDDIDLLWDIMNMFIQSLEKRLNILRSDIHSIYINIHIHTCMHVCKHILIVTYAYIYIGKHTHIYNM